MWCVWVGRGECGEHVWVGRGECGVCGWVGRGECGVCGWAEVSVVCVGEQR